MDEKNTCPYGDAFPCEWCQIAFEDFEECDHVVVSGDKT